MASEGERRQQQAHLSLLWPAGAPASRDRRAHNWAGDVDLDRLVQALAHSRRQAGFVRSILVALATDADTIRYRQAVLADISDDQGLHEALAALLPSLVELNEVRQYLAGAQDNELLQVLQRLRELELYVEAARSLAAALAGAGGLRSAGLLRLRDDLAATIAEPAFCQLVEALPALRAAMQKLTSVTIGVNLDEQGRPVAATILGVSDRKFAGKPNLLGRILGRDAGEEAEVGIAHLHESVTGRANPFLQPIFRDLAEVLRLSARPVARALARFAHVSIAPLAGLAGEVAFYLGAARLGQRLRQAGLALCLPRIVDGQERVSRVDGLYNPSLALRMLDREPRPGEPPLPVPSDLCLGEEGRCAVLTGPNMGGKTTYVQAAALAHVLAQAGLFVPGTAAAISPVDAIHTHFPQVEAPDKALGRLGEEAQRLAAVFAEASPRGLILLNESLASTSPGEGLYLARDVLVALRLLGARAIFATHLHELAAHLDEIDAAAPGEPPTVSLVAGVLPPEERANGDDLGRTYRVRRGPPQGRSHAEEIARRHGISLEQLRERLRQRGIGTER